jgi:hypothetical protein
MGSGVFVSLAVALLFCLVVLFPDGRLPSRWWRPVLWSVCAVAAGWGAQQLQAGTSISGGLTNALDAARASYPNPLGIFPRHGWFSGLIAVIYGLGVVTGVLVVASVLVRRRGASAEARKQLAWLGYVGVMTAVWVAVLAVDVGFTGGNNEVASLGWAFLVLTPVAGIPLACAVAVLKCRLYDIDRIISRTLAYAIVTGLLVGIYAGAGAAGHPGLPVRRSGSGGRIDAGGGGTVQPGAQARAARGGPAVQPDPVWRRPDRRSVRGAAERRDRPEHDQR